MNDGGRNPCDVCKAKDRASGCGGCVLDMGYSSGECHNDKCMVNYECGCLLGLNSICKSSTCYEDDYRNHSCGECLHFEARYGKCGEEITYCSLTNEDEFDFDNACKDFKECEEDDE